MLSSVNVLFIPGLPTALRNSVWG